MKAIFDFFRKVFATLILVIFLTILSIAPSLLSLSNLVTNRNTVINWINRADIYDEIIEITLKNVTEDLKKQGMKSTEIKAVQTQLKKSINTTFVKNSTESLINGVYDWLEQKTNNIEIDPQKIDIKSALIGFIPKDDVNSKEFMQLLNSLKPCTEKQALKYEQLGGFKSVEDFCIPPRLDLIKITNDSYKENITNKTIKVDNIFQIPEVPKEQSDLIIQYYSILQNLELYVFGTLLILAILYLLIYPPSTFKYIALGALSLLTALIQFVIVRSTNYLQKIVESLINNSIPKDFEFSSKMVTDFASMIMNDILANSFIYIYYILGGSVLLISLALLYQYFSNSKENKVVKKK